MVDGGVGMRVKVSISSGAELTVQRATNQTIADALDRGLTTARKVLTELRQAGLIELRCDTPNQGHGGFDFDSSAAPAHGPMDRGLATTSQQPLIPSE